MTLIYGAYEVKVFTLFLLPYFIPNLSPPTHACW